MPSGYTPTPKAVGVPSLVLDGDRRNAASVNAPMQTIADLAVYARTALVKNYRLVLAENGSVIYNVAEGLGAAISGTRPAIFLATGSGGTYRSYSCEAWEETAAGSWWDAAYSPTLDLWAVCGMNAATSPDTTTWTPRTTPASTILRAMTVASDGAFVAVGDMASNNETYIVRSADGVTWAQMVAPNDHPMADVIKGPTGRLVAVGGLGEPRIIVSDDDGTTWTDATPPVGISEALTAVSYNGTYFVARASDGDIARSPNGVDWEATNATGLAGFTAPGRGVLACDPSTGVILTASGASGRLAVSYDHGFTFQTAQWIAHAAFTLSVLSGLSFAHGRFLVGTTNGYIAAGLAR